MGSRSPMYSPLIYSSGFSISQFLLWLAALYCSVGLFQQDSRRTDDCSSEYIHLRRKKSSTVIKILNGLDKLIAIIRDKAP